MEDSNPYESPQSEESPSELPLAPWQIRLMVLCMTVPFAVAFDYWYYGRSVSVVELFLCSAALVYLGIRSGELYSCIRQRTKS